MAHDVFISHAHGDKVTAQKVCARLEQLNIGCWIAPRDIRPGADWATSIVDAIRRCQAMVLILSDNANRSAEIPKEVLQALKHGLSIIAFRIEDVAPAGSLDYNLSTVHWLDATSPPIEPYIDDLAAALHEIVGRVEKDSSATTKGDPVAKAGASIRANAGTEPLVSGKEAPPAEGEHGAASAKRTHPRRATIFPPIAFALTVCGILFGAVTIPSPDSLNGFLKISLGAAFFGLALAMLTISRWRARIVIAVASIAIYFGAYFLAYWSASEWKWPNWSVFLLPGVLGAIAVTIALALANPRFWKALPVASACGLLAGALIWQTDLDLANIFTTMLWQVFVGSALAHYAYRNVADSPIARHADWRPVAAVSLAAVLYGSATTIYAVTRPDGGTPQVNAADSLYYRWIPPGKFRMGCSNGDDQCAPDESPQVAITISTGFWLGQSEVTRRAWNRVLGDSSHTVASSAAEADSVDALPVTNVSWTQAAHYCSAISGRLPSESEWEYAARAGSSESRYERLSESAWYANNSGKKLIDANAIPLDRYAKAMTANGNGVHRVEKRDSNSWYLHDMLGNVLEWVEDDYGTGVYESMSKTGGSEAAHFDNGFSPVKVKVVRGGSWYSPEKQVRASARLAEYPDSGYVNVGFRCVWTPASNYGLP
jgi:formylglycine-generating enzyme required for sulfatase activity